MVCESFKISQFEKHIQTENNFSLKQELNDFADDGRVGHDVLVWEFQPSFWPPPVDTYGCVRGY